MTASSASVDSTISVATWNLAWRFVDWERRQQPIIETLAAVDADVVTLQETWPAQIDAIAEALGGYGTWAGHTPDESTGVVDDAEVGGFGNGVISRWPISGRASLLLADDRGRRYRSIVCARIDAPQRPLTIATTHLDHGYAHSSLRQQQLQKALEFVAEQQGDTQAVLTGDLNAVPDSDEIRRLTGRSTPYLDGSIWTDAWEVAGSGPGHTWAADNPWLGEPTWPNRRLDYVMVGWPRVERPIGNPVRARRFGNEEVAGIVPSDHYGVVADLVW